MEKAARRMALFGGTFDPIHNGHVQMALEFARRLQLDRVLLMPTFVPPHKMKQQMASVEDRLADSDLDDAVVYALVYTIRSLSEKRQAIHPDTFAAYNDLVLSKR